MNYNELQNSRSRTETARPNGSQKIQSPITMFSLPKAFTGEAKLIQRNAIASWSKLFPAVSVVLIGDEVGIAETADEFGCIHVPDVRRNELGTPLVSSAFQSARQISESPFLAYCNADVILFEEFVEAIQSLADSNLEKFVAIGRRTDLNVQSEIDFDCQLSVRSLLERAASEGQTGPVVCKEYFAFSRDLYDEIPDFAVGRGNWDNWMVAEAKALDVPVVNISKLVLALHQMHGYCETSQQNRLKCYATGSEAVENKRLAGGAKLVRGSSSTWKLDENGLNKKRFGSLNPDFWIDSRRFLRLVLNLLISRR